MNLEYIHNIVKASGVSSGETILVHFWGEDADKAIANEFIAAAASLGAAPLLLQQSRTVNRAIFASTSPECFGEQYFEMLSHFDAVLDVFTYQPIVLGSELPPEQMALYRRYISKLFYALMKAKRFTQIRIPTAANAAESSLDPAEYMRRMEAAYNIDYTALANACASAKKKMEMSNRYVLHTGNSCRLDFDLTGRQWRIDAGDGDWPCGEIYIAPVEDRTHGTVFFDKLWLEDVGFLTDVTFSVADGRIVDSNQEAVNEFLSGLAPEAKVLCELGLGMNPNVTDLCGYPLLDEKMTNSFHIAIGANTMFGGQNDAKLHIDLVNGGSFTLIPEE